MKTNRKKAISFRIQEETLAWFKRQAPTGYQTVMHSVLERYVEERKARAQWIAGRAQEIFHRFYAQCFWHYDKNLTVGPDEVPLIIDGLRKYGGREGLTLADELCQ